MDIRTCINLAEALNEASRAYLYHGTSFSGAAQILSSGYLEASDKRADDWDTQHRADQARFGVASNGYHHVSLTRDPRLRFYDNDGSDEPGSSPVVFVLDQERIQQQTRRVPFDFHGEGDRRSESEEQAVAFKVMLKGICVAIRLYDRPRGKQTSLNTDDLYHMGFEPDTDSESKIKRGLPQGRRDAYAKIISLAQRLGIPIQDFRGKDKQAVGRAHARANIDQMKGRPIQPIR